MKVCAPGKLMITGAYAVLDGAPAIVAAVDRCAVADASVRDASPSREVRAAFGESDAPAVDVRALYEGEAKLGLGSSAAALVAALGARAAARGENVQSATVRDALFGAARDAHARAQGGGSGVDIAASVYGGVLAYRLDAASGARASARVRPAFLPAGLVLRVVWSGVSARTSDLRARVDALRARDPGAHAACFGALADASIRALDTIADLGAFLGAARATGVGLAALGRAADAPIVPPAFADLAALALAEGAVFLPSGAGGGDVGVYLGAQAPSESFLGRLASHGMRPLAMGLDPDGVRPLEVTPTIA